jgi:hypothetical protein
MNWIKKFTFATIVTIFSFEALSFIATKLKLFLVNYTPSLYLKNTVNHNYKDIIYGRTEREKWGAWHVPNSTFNHRQACFDVKMTFNEVGARDDSFHNVPESALILLGDSFAEGFGVARENMSEYLIEREFKVPILNFGASGNFGPLQELIIYEEFKYLPHQGIIIYVLPANDFTDNDQETWEAINQNRYRPYFSKEGNPLIPYYFPSSVKRDNFISPKLGWFQEFLKEYTWSSNAILTAIILMRGYIGYYDPTILQQSNLVLAYEAILKAAGDRNVLFVIIPTPEDITRKDNDLDPFSYRSAYWYQSFANFKNRTEQRVEVLDLMDHLPERTTELFFDCDDHWSPSGNFWAANVISDFIRSKKLFEIQN